MEDSTDKKVEFAAIAYYNLSGLIESLVALALLLRVPPDPKNAWLFGYSPARVLMVAALAAIALLFAVLSYKTFADRAWMQRWLSRLDFGNGALPLFLLLAGLVFVLVVVYPHAYYRYRHSEALIERVVPFLFLAATRAVQTLLVGGWLWARQLSKSEQARGRAFSPRNVAILLAACVFLLISADLSGYVLRNSYRNARTERYYAFFNVDQENNLPAYFSAFDLLLAGTILFGIAGVEGRAKDRYTLAWGSLSLIFVYLALDEVFALHEKAAGPLDRLFQASGVIGFFPWLIAAIPLVVILGLVYLRFFLHLPRRTQWLLFAAGTIYLLGAIGFEMMGGWYTLRFGISKPARFLLYTVEETFEMLGIVLLIYGLLEYRARSHAPIMQAEARPAPSSHAPS